MTECNINVEILDGEFCQTNGTHCKLFDSEYEFCHLFPDNQLDFDRKVYLTIKHKNCPLLIKKREEESNNDYTI
jgi:hypothetical protein